MNDRARALEILRRAQAELAERLTARILQSESEILDDAQGARYLSEIEAIYDELGGRLAHLGAMLNHLPPLEQELDHVELPDEVEDEPVDLPPPRRGFLALPPPRRSHGDPSHALHGFLQSVHRGELTAAAARLVELFEIDVPRAQRCADVFAVQAALRPELYTQVMRLRVELLADRPLAAEQRLGDCFGLEPREAAAVVLVVRHRYGFDAGSRIERD